MSVDGVRKALEAIDDETIRGQVAAGEFGALADDLTEDEQAIMKAAADDYPDDVEGFGGFLKLGDIKGESLNAAYPKIETSSWKVGGYRTATEYAFNKF